MRLYREALKLLPAGVSSNARVWRKLCPVYTPCALFVARARGSHIWDVDGNEYIDYRLGFGPVILGHSDPGVHAAVHAVDEDGLVYALSHELELEVAKKIRSLVPCAEMVRYANSGTEATMHALRVARGVTGRDKVVKFEGMYHGAHDYLLWSTEPPFRRHRYGAGKPWPSSAGLPRALSKLVLVQRWNDFDGVERCLRREGERIAALIAEPIMGNSAAIPPAKGFLEHLRRLCNEHGILLIFDEVKTGFRVAPGGAQELYGVTPDLATFAKALGNGYPVALFAGKRKFMEMVGPLKVVHGGTYSGNPVSLAAASATLDRIRSGRVHQKLHRYGRDLIQGLRDVFADKGVPAQVVGVPEMFQVVFTKGGPPREYRDLGHADLDAYARWQLELLRRGVMIDEDNMECWFICAAHDREDMEATLENAS